MSQFEPTNKAPTEFLDPFEPHVNILDNTNNSSKQMKTIQVVNEDEDSDLSSEEETDDDSDDFWDKLEDFKYEQVDVESLRARFEQIVNELRNTNQKPQPK